MTETTKTTGSELETRARELFIKENGENSAGLFDNLDEEQRESWLDEARKTPPTAKSSIRRGLNLRALEPFEAEAVEATGIDPRTHHKSEHAKLTREYGEGVKAIKLLAKPSPEDEEIRRELLERGYPVFTTNEGEIPPNQLPAV